MEEIESVDIGSILVESDEEEGITLDSYQELDLARLRAKWEELLEKRAKYLEKEIHTIGNNKKEKKDEFEEERERALLMNWMQLIEERNAISIPTAGIPGAPSTADLDKMGTAGFEKHCPLIFLQNGPNRFEEDGQEEEEEMMPMIGANNYLPFEYDDGQLELPIGQREMGEVIEGMGNGMKEFYRII
jgi:kinesin family member 13